MLNMSNCRGFNVHRHGWGFVIDSIKHLHTCGGIILDDFIERNFAWEYSQYHHGNPHNLPYTMPWIGIIHNPPNHPIWFDYENSIHSIFGRSVFQASLRHCMGIIALSEHLASSLRGMTQVPVECIYHPTETNVGQWSPFEYGKSRTVVQLGYWLRKMQSITKVVRVDYNKEWLPSDYDYALKKMEQEARLEGLHHEDIKARWKSVKIHRFLQPEDFDRKLESAVVLCDLYDASANNAVIECIARSTPIVINRIPAVEEYLGADYPLYIDNSIDECLEPNRVIEAHNYLKDMDKKHITKEYFVERFEKCLEKLIHYRGNM